LKKIPPGGLRGGNISCARKGLYKRKLANLRLKYPGGEKPPPAVNTKFGRGLKKRALFSKEKPAGF